MYEKLLDRILEQLNQLLPNDVADILLLKQGVIHSVHWRGYEKFGLQDTINKVSYNLSDTANFRTIRETGRPLAIPFVEQYRHWVARPGLDWIKSQASAPIRIGDQIIVPNGSIGMTNNFLIPVTTMAHTPHIILCTKTH